MDNSGSNISLKAKVGSQGSSVKNPGGSGLSLQPSSSQPAQSSTTTVELEPEPAPPEKARRISIPAYTISSIQNNKNVPARTRRLSGKYNAEVWKKIFGDIDPASVIKFDNEDEEAWEPESATEANFGVNFSEDLFGIPTTSGASGEIMTASSIFPAAITLSTEDLKSWASQDGGGFGEAARPPPQPGKIQRIKGCLACRPPVTAEAEEYAKLKSKFSKASSLVDKFYKALAIDFEEIEMELEFDASAQYPLGQELNVTAAQMWFISLALSKQLEQRIRFDPETEKKLLQCFQSIIGYSVCIARCVPRIEQLVSEYELEGLVDAVGQMKKSFTGKSDTDLTQEKFVDEVFTSSVNAPHNQTDKSWRILDNKPTQQYGRKPSISEQLGMFGSLHHHEDHDYHPELFLDFMQPDTLKDRKNLEIYVRNVTKVGWISFEKKFPREKKFLVEYEFLCQVKNVFKTLSKTTSRILRHLEHGGAGDRSTSRRILRRLGTCTCSHSCLLWISGMKKYIDQIVKSDQYSTDDHEFLRLRILSAEMHLEKIVSQGTAITQKMSNVLSVVVLCCDFLSHVHRFHLANYEKLRNQMILEPKAATTISRRSPGFMPSTSRSFINAGSSPTPSRISRRLSRKPSRKSQGGQEEKLDDADFYLNEYAMLLKVVPVSFGLMEYVLVNRIDSLERHSGVNFDGPRYLNVCHS